MSRRDLFVLFCVVGFVAAFSVLLLCFCGLGVARIAERCATEGQNDCISGVLQGHVTRHNFTLSTFTQTSNKTQHPKLCFEHWSTWVPGACFP